MAVQTAAQDMHQRSMVSLNNSQMNPQMSQQIQTLPSVNASQAISNVVEETGKKILEEHKYFHKVFSENVP